MAQPLRPKSTNGARENFLGLTNWCEQWRATFRRQARRMQATALGRLQTPILPPITRPNRPAPDVYSRPEADVAHVLWAYAGMRSPKIRFNARMMACEHVT